MSWSSGESSRASTPSLGEQETFDDCATGLEDHSPPSDAPVPPTPEVLTSADNSQQPALDESPTPLFRNVEKKAEMVPKEKVIKLLKGKEKEWTKVVEKKGPLRLLDLPVDILQEIIAHVGIGLCILDITDGELMLQRFELTAIMGAQVQP